MSLRSIPRSVEEQNQTIARFSDSSKETPEDLDARRELQSDIKLAVQHLASLIDGHIEPCRESSVALTKLKEVQMWANAGVFA